MPNLHVYWKQKCINFSTFDLRPQWGHSLLRRSSLRLDDDDDLWWLPDVEEWCLDEDLLDRWLLLLWWDDEWCLSDEDVFLADSLESLTLTELPLTLICGDCTTWVAASTLILAGLIGGWVGEQSERGGDTKIPSCKPPPVWKVDSGSSLPLRCFWNAINRH